MAEALEQGNIYFFFRPKVAFDHAENRDDAQRFYMVLRPDTRAIWRLILIGNERLPEVETHEKFWGFVEEVVGGVGPIEPLFKSWQNQTKTRGAPVEPAARSVGQGRYEIVRHGEHTHLTYKLALPRQPGLAQQSFHIEPQASYIIAIKNPKRENPAGVGLGPHEKARYPKQIEKQIFDGLRFVPAYPVHLLDFPGTEFTLIGAERYVESELGVEPGVKPQPVSELDVFNELHMAAAEMNEESLPHGDWAW